MVIQNSRRSTISGSWLNELGTRMTIVANDRGRVTGEIRSEVGGVGDEQPVVGYLAPWPAQRGVIGLVVPWAETASVTTWSGHFDLDADVIVANWLLTTADFEENEWQSTRVGRDVFRRVGTLSSANGRRHQSA